jgi:hypothetical protein
MPKRLLFPVVVGLLAYLLVYLPDIGRRTFAEYFESMNGLGGIFCAIMFGGLVFFLVELILPRILRNRPNSGFYKRNKKWYDQEVDHYNEKLARIKEYDEGTEKISQIRNKAARLQR